MYLDIGMVAADTTRTRSYVCAMIRHGLLPTHVLLLENTEAGLLPGQACAAPAAPGAAGVDDCWSETDFDASTPLRRLLDHAKINHETAPTRDINDPAVIERIAARPETVMIYSGFGGVLLRDPVLATGKRFLHVHGGYLPTYKGSTTNYFKMCIRDRYQPGFRKGQGESGQVDLYRQLGLVLCLRYHATGQLRYLSTLLKLTDLLCSLPPTDNPAGPEAELVGLIVSAEVAAVRALAARQGVQFVS